MCRHLHRHVLVAGDAVGVYVDLCVNMRMEMHAGIAEDVPVAGDRVGVPRVPGATATEHHPAHCAFAHAHVCARG